MSPKATEELQQEHIVNPTRVAPSSTVYVCMCGICVIQVIVATTNTAIWLQHGETKEH